MNEEPDALRRIALSLCNIENSISNMERLYAQQMRRDEERQREFEKRQKKWDEKEKRWDERDKNWDEMGFYGNPWRQPYAIAMLAIAVAFVVLSITVFLLARSVH
jgi:hypothetical protein